MMSQPLPGAAVPDEFLMLISTLVSGIVASEEQSPLTLDPCARPAAGKQPA